MLPRGFKASSERWAAQLRTALQLPVDGRLPAQSLADHLEIEVWKVGDVPDLPGDTHRHLTETDPDCWSAVTVREGGTDVIVINSAHSEKRREQSVLHELSHVVLRHRPARVDVNDDGLLLCTFDRDQEDQADWLAGALHLPRTALMRARRSNMDEAQISVEFMASTQLIQWRINATGVAKQMRRGSGSAAP